MEGALHLKIDGQKYVIGFDVSEDGTDTSCAVMFRVEGDGSMTFIQEEYSLWASGSFRCETQAPNGGRSAGIYGYGKLKSDESKALSEALNPFAREKEGERMIAGMIQRDLDAFMDDKPSIVGDVIAGRTPRPPRSGATSIWRGRLAPLNGPRKS